MRLKSYFAPTVEAAMNMARMELGAEAMLVSSRRTDEEARHLGHYEVVFATSAYAAAGLTPGAVDGVASASAAPQPVDRLAQEVAGLKREMERLASALSRSSVGLAKMAASPDLAQAFSMLVDCEFDADLAHDLVWRITAAAESGNCAPGRNLLQLIAAELAHQIRADAGLNSAANTVVLVGPPGSGKTTTLAKLAIQYGLGGRRSSQILSLDVHRVAAAEQLRSYAAIAGLAFEALETPRALSQALEEYSEKSMIFIDTPGLSGEDFEDSAEMANLLARHPRVEVHLVLNACMKPADMKRIAASFEIFRPAKLIFTHLDETEAFGSLGSLSIRTGKPISFLGSGQRIPEDLSPANVSVLVEKILRGAQWRQELSVTAAA